MLKDSLGDIGDFIYYEARGIPGTDEMEYADPRIIGTLEIYNGSSGRCLERGVEILRGLIEEPRCLQCLVIGMAKDFDFLVGRKPDKVVEHKAEEENTDATL